MNPELIPQMVEMWLAVNVAALAVLALMAYVSSKYILDWLESLDRWMANREAKCGNGADMEKTAVEAEPKA